MIKKIWSLTAILVIYSIKYDLVFKNYAPCFEEKLNKISEEFEKNMVSEEAEENVEEGLYQ